MYGTCGSCIGRSQVCDCNRDCSFGDDEDYCPGKKKKLLRQHNANANDPSCDWIKVNIEVEGEH